MRWRCRNSLPRSATSSSSPASRGRREPCTSGFVCSTGGLPQTARRPASTSRSSTPTTASGCRRHLRSRGAVARSARASTATTCSPGPSPATVAARRRASTRGARYALDSLDGEEEHGFEEHLAACESCREELAGLREAASYLAYAASGPVPPPALKERILEQARSERPNVVPLTRRRGWVAPLAAAASLAAAVALGLGVWSATRPATSDAFATVLAQPGSKLVPMGDRGALAVAPDGTAALALTVPRAPEGKTYEAWVINSGTPTRAGLFEG